MRITQLKDHGDDRGFSAACRSSDFRLPERLAEVHCTTVLPGKVRGNHYHRTRTEALLVFHLDGFTVAWDEGADTLVHTREFDGSGTVVIEVSRDHAHAIHNTGRLHLVVVALSSHIYAPDDPDAFRRVVVAVRDTP
jgi:dTDP-4-dehydrorhamnose 3,5-epimerase-like enzyme